MNRAEMTDRAERVALARLEDAVTCYTDWRMHRFDSDREAAQALWDAGYRDLDNMSPAARDAVDAILYGEGAA